MNILNMFNMLCDGASKEILMTLKKKKSLKQLLVVPGDTDELAKWQLSELLLKGLSSCVEHTEIQGSRCFNHWPFRFQVHGSLYSIITVCSPAKLFKTPLF